MKRVILASGGLDSFLTWHLYDKQATNLFVDLGQPYADKERQSLRRLWVNVPQFNYQAVKGPDWSGHELPGGIIPMRNAMLILMAAQVGEDILIGVLADEVNSDKSFEFMQAIGAAMSISGRGQYWNDYRGQAYQVRSPISPFTKTQLVERYLAGGGHPRHLLLTVSCYTGTGGKQCGACASCFKRWVALHLNGLEEEYDHNPRDYGRMRGYDRAPVDMAAAQPYWSELRVLEISRAMVGRVA